MARGDAPVREGFIAGHGARIYFKALGSGPPLMLLHGGPGADHGDFLPALAPLAGSCRLILIDERGCGRSERLRDPGGYTLDLMVADIECVRRALDLPRFVLLGHSFGGILAQAYAVRHPRRLAGLILAGTASRARDVNADFRRLLERLPPRQRDRVRRLEEAGIFRPDGGYVPQYAAATARALAPAMYAQRSRRPRRSARPLGLDVLKAMWGDRSDFKIHGNLQGFDFTRQLPRLRAPSLVVIGDRDIVSPASAERSRASLGSATLVIMAQSAHMMFVDQRRRFCRLVEDFVQECAGVWKEQAS